MSVTNFHRNSPGGGVRGLALSCQTAYVRTRTARTTELTYRNPAALCSGSRFHWNFAHQVWRHTFFL